METKESQPCHNHKHKWYQVSCNMDYDTRGPHWVVVLHCENCTAILVERDYYTE